MNINSNGYTFTFAGIMVVVAALLLSTAAISLKPAQDKNIELEKKQSILATLQEVVTREESEAKYASIISEALVVSSTGDLKAGKDAFVVDLAGELVKPLEERDLPLFVGKKDSSVYYVIPVRGKGLWGPIWGFVSLKDDFNTVYGAYFDHKSETPGLGAEISISVFEDQFIGKKIMEAGEFKSIQVRKGDASGDFQVNGISGGTITSVGVEAMLKDCLIQYLPYFNKISATRADSSASTAPVTETSTVNS